MAHAGHFGEGAKVEINRLVQEGCTVTYCTGNAIWMFERAVAPGCTIPELHVKIHPGLDTFDFVGIAITAKYNYSGRLLEDERFLFLLRHYNKIASAPVPSRDWSGMELLLDPCHHGKVFVQSIFVMDAPTYKEFGIKYTGRLIFLAVVVLTLCLLLTCQYSGSGDKTIFQWGGTGP